MCASIRLMVREYCRLRQLIPFTRKDERQRFANVALGTFLPLTFYEPLHSSERTEVHVVDLFSENDDIPTQVKHLSFIYMRHCN